MPILDKLFGAKSQETRELSFSVREQVDNNVLNKNNQTDNQIKPTPKSNQQLDTFENSINYMSDSINKSNRDINDLVAEKYNIKLERNEKNNIDKGKKDNSKKYSITKDKKDLSDSEKRLIAELEKMDRAVKAHEAAHKAAGGGLVRGGATYNYVIGPDGKRYASSGEVKIDMSYNMSDPEATIRKMEQVKRAALAPIDPSAQDRAVAQKAAAIETEARNEEQEQQAEKIAKLMVSVHKSTSLQAYGQKNNLGQIVNEYR